MNTFPLTDSFGRKHDYLRVSLTERCNLRCKYCMPADGIPLTPKSHLPTDQELIQIVQTFVDLGVDKIRFTGGEPLVRKNVGNIIQQIADLNTKLAITTNGILLDDHLDLFEKIGLKSLNISLDTLDEDRFLVITRRNQFQRVMDNITSALDRGFHVKINVVLMKNQNEDEILDFIRWSVDKPVHVRFIEFMPFDGNEWGSEKLVSYFEIIDLIKEHFSIEKLEDAPHATTKGYRVKGAAGTFAVISSMTAPFCSTCNRLRLTADGKMRNCLFATEETDLLTPLRNGEDIRPLILKSVLDKKAAHAGMEILKNQKNRSMIAIGG